jgi:hypothetical protein
MQHQNIIIVCSNKLNKINPRLCAEATFSFISSSLSLDNNNVTAVSFHNAKDSGSH